MIELVSAAALPDDRIEVVYIEDGEQKVFVGGSYTNMTHYYPPAERFPDGKVKPGVYREMTKDERREYLLELITAQTPRRREIDI